jgi:MFS family permease
MSRSSIGGAPTMVPSDVLKKTETRKVIFASSLGAAFEWYDFSLYGALAPVIAKQFFSGFNDTAGFVFALLVFASGLIVRPFGSLVFGRIGDMAGRKFTFILTIVLMALPTLFIGFLPGSSALGIGAPIILTTLRVLQGLAVGGEYGGAVIYVAEYSEASRRGQNTAYINAMAAFGFIIAMLVIFLTRKLTSVEDFNAWGWRIPFIASTVLFFVTMRVRLKLKESPVFLEMKAAGKTSRRPILDAFGNKKSALFALLLTVGGTAALGAMAYTTQFYAQYFLTRTVKIDPVTVNWIFLIGLIVSLPSYIFFGWLSDRIGRKPVIFAGAILGMLCFQPAFHAIVHYGNPALEVAQTQAPIKVIAEPSECSFQFNPVGAGSKFLTSCDIAKAYLAQQMVSYTNEAGTQGEPAQVVIGSTRVVSFEGSKLTAADLSTKTSGFNKSLAAALKLNGYPTEANPETLNTFALTAIVIVFLILYAAVYSPMGAWLTEMFPANIRYTSISLPYNIGTGWFGGLMPATAFAMVAANGNIYFGLWYPITILVVAVIFGFIFLPETHKRSLFN